MSSFSSCISTSLTLSPSNQSVVNRTLANRNAPPFPSFAFPLPKARIGCDQDSPTSSPTGASVNTFMLTWTP
ncbi:uncharacterized protein BDV17DRAFT_64059 [Aspergillus undulatus]|uniref:uncharacterized protein n=1 Tax=Aspergillus undulatus TaxID=1810928 RepID=UPI003CCDC31E